MKKKNLLLALSSLTMLVGCGNISFDAAKEFAKTNYSQDAASAKYASGSVKTVTEYTKAEGIFQNVKLGKTENTGDASILVLTEAGVAVYGDKATYSTSGKSLKITYNMDAADFIKNYLGLTVDAKSMKGTAKVVYSYNSDGLIASSSSKFDFSLNSSTAGISITGALKGSSSAKYTYTKK